MSPARLRFGDHLFDPATGELTRPESGGGTERLPPKPAALLALLLSRQGEVVPREDIRAALWPDVEVDFESGLNFCIRQVRAALGDTAAEPRYIETLPRRGYRLKAEVRDHQPATAKPPTPPRPSRWLASTAALLAVAAVLGASVRPPAPLTLAILPTELTQEPSPDRLAELLVLRLGRLPPEALGVIGPTTTAAYGEPSIAWRRMIDELGVDYFLNARPVTNTPQPTFLAELIRASDGVHVWVERYPHPKDWSALAEEIAHQVQQQLDLAP